MGRKFWYRHADTDGEWLRSHHPASFGSDVAEAVAEHMYNDDPVRPDLFTGEVWVKDEFGWQARFLVTAEATVNFTATEDNPPTTETTRMAEKKTE